MRQAERLPPCNPVFSVTIAQAWLRTSAQIHRGIRRRQDGIRFATLPQETPWLSSQPVMRLPYRILVLEDDEHTLDGIVELLREAGHNVTGATTYDAAKRLLAVVPTIC